MSIAKQRLVNQHIACQHLKTPAEVVAWLGALQAQDYPGARWSIGLRLANSVVGDVDRAIADRTIIRTWPMRGTLHIVPAADVRWMLRLMTPRPIAAAALRRSSLGLEISDFVKAETAFIKHLEGGRQLTRDEMYGVMEDAGVSAAGQRGIHIIRHLAMVGLLCFGSHVGKQPSFALLDDWCPNALSLERDESLAELTRRYFTSHGPATVDDFVRWTGLSVGDAKTGLSFASSSLTSTKIDGKAYWTIMDGPDPAEPGGSAYLLPGFDEFMLGYRDRSAALDPAFAESICPGGNGMFLATTVLDGAVSGTWKQSATTRKLTIQHSPFRRFTSTEEALIAEAADRYRRFLGYQT